MLDYDGSGTVGTEEFCDGVIKAAASAREDKVWLARLTQVHELQILSSTWRPRVVYATYKELGSLDFRCSSGLLQSDLKHFSFGGFRPLSL